MEPKISSINMHLNTSTVMSLITCYTLNKKPTHLYHSIFQVIIIEKTSRAHFQTKTIYKIHYINSLI